MPQGPVYMYYGLSNFYQNHRRYVKSRDDNQLLGRLGAPAYDCMPFNEILNGSVREPIAPCGAIANSLFSGEYFFIVIALRPCTFYPLSSINDQSYPTIACWYNSTIYSQEIIIFIMPLPWNVDLFCFADELKIINSSGYPVPLLKTGIAWSSDKKHKFRNPPVDPEIHEPIEALKKGLVSNFKKNH